MSKAWEKFLDKTAAREMKRLERAADSQLYFVRDAQNNEEAHMTYEEAAELLEYGESEEAIYLAIEALEKQIPKKPRYFIQTDDGLTETEVDEFEYYVCACCDSEIFIDNDGYYGERYCDKCGQRIDWSEVE